MPPSSSTTSRPAGRLAAGLTGAALLLLLCWSPALSANLARLDHCPYLACDFQVVYLPQARRLYEGFVHGDWNYPPLLAILLQPLAFLSTPAAVWAWSLLQLGLLAAQAGLCAQILPGERRERWAAGLALCLLCLPVIHSLKWGQVSLGIGLAAAYALRSGGPAAALIGIGAAIKLYPGLWLAGLWRDRRALGWGIGAALAGLALPALLLPAAQMQQFQEAVLRHQLAHHAGALVSAASLGGQGLQVSLIRWFIDGSTFGGADHAPLLVPLPGAITAAGLLPLIGVPVGMRSGDPDRRAAHLLCGLSLALQPAWHHYFSFLPFVWAVGLRDGRRGLTLASVAMSALPLALLPWSEQAYYLYTAWGGTTLSALLAWAALIRPPSSPGSGGSAPAQRSATPPPAAQ